MILLSAKSIPIKMNQDRILVNDKMILLCDGIGSFKDSGSVAEMVVNQLQFAESNLELKSHIVLAYNEIINSQLIGGTTFISAFYSTEKQKLFLAYLGNGSIYHFNGDLFDLPENYSEINKVYRYVNYLLPHVDKHGALTKHISYTSEPNQLEPSCLELNLNNMHGDVIFMFTDGISSIEEDLIIEDDNCRLWRNQSEILNRIFVNWHKWMKENYLSLDKSILDKFLEDELMTLKEEQKLEDDASIGIIITEKVIEYYKSHFNAGENI